MALENICTCGACGRVELKLSAAKIAAAKAQGGQPSPGFGLHTVLAAGAYRSRSKASGNMTVADIEAIFDRKVTPALKNGSKITPWMDYNTALYVADLSDYTTPFKADNVPYMPILLNDSHFNKSYPAVYVHIPLTQVTFLLVAASTGLDNDAHWTDGTAVIGEAMDFSGYPNNQPPLAEAGIAYPLAISRSVSDIQEMIDFYQDVFDVQPTFQEKLSTGGTMISYTLPRSAVAIRYIQRPEGASAQDGHSTKWFQDYLNTVVTHYQTTYKSCWPIWGDNHYCYDSGTQTLDTVVAKYEANKGKRGYVYHPFRNPGGRTCNAYFGEPSGWQFQLDGIYSTCPTDAESFSPAYCTTACENAPPPPSKYPFM